MGDIIFQTFSCEGCVFEKDDLLELTVSLGVLQSITQIQQASGIQQHFACFFSLNTHQTGNIVDIWKIK